MRQERHDLDDQVFGMAQAIKGRALRRCESLAALLAFIALVLLAMNDDVTLARLRFGRTVRVGAECCMRVHVFAGCPCSIGVDKETASRLDSRFVKNICLHALLWSYPQEYLDKKFHEVNQNIKHSTEELARIFSTTIAEPMERQFDEIKTLLDTREKVTHMEA